MKSKVFVTHQIDEPESAVAELADGAKAFALEKNTVGILFCYADCEVAEIAAGLDEQIPFDIVGCTTIASMDGVEGFHPMAATLLVLTADDCAFGVGLSDPICPENAVEQIRRAYQRATAHTQDVPGLVFAVPPYQLEIMLDVYTETFGQIAPGVPFVGGIPSYIGDADASLTSYQGKAYPDRMLMVAITGNIRPVLTVQTIPHVQPQRKGRVTRSKDNIIYEVGGQPFFDYMEKLGMPVDRLAEGNTAVTFVSIPLLLEHTAVGVGEDVAFLRTLHEVNREERSGVSIGKIPQGATISICPLNREDIVEGAVLGVQDLKEKMAAVKGYEFSTVLMVSCVGRHLIMSPKSSMEVDGVLAGALEGVYVGGFYCYGEIGPISNSNASVTFAHNESLVLCAF